MRNAAPRFGRSTEISDFLDGSKNASRDYIAGLMAGALVVFFVLSGWLTLIQVLRRMGPDKVGLFSGRLCSKGDKPTFRQKRNQRNAQFVVLFCNLSIVLFAILMSTMGLGSLHDASDIVLQGATDGEMLVNEATSALDHLMFVADNAKDETYKFSHLVNRFCPKVRSKVCVNLESDDIEVQCDLSGIPYAAEVERLLNAPQNYTTDFVQSARNDTAQIADLFTTVLGSSSAYGIMVLLLLVRSYAFSQISDPFNRLP